LYLSGEPLFIIKKALNRVAGQLAFLNIIFFEIKNKNLRHQKNFLLDTSFDQGINYTQ
jgi:hypothetical protein